MNPSGATSQSVSRQILALFEGGTMAGFTDGELLGRFLESPDATAEAAFTALAERHGPMVLRVCRAILGDAEATNDAFQATFLVLVKSARRVRRRESVASWLHGVARRVANRARVDAARRKRREREAAMHAASRETTSSEPCPELHEEIDRLPGHFREPLVLCYLEGLSTEAAAERLGCPKGTVLSRLSRARDRLRDRLTRRGVAVPTALAAGALTGEGASAAVPAALLSQTVRAGLALAGRHELATASAIPAAASTLATGVLKAMTTTKLLTIGAAALASVAMVGGGTTLSRQIGASDRSVMAVDDPPNADGSPLEDYAKLKARYLELEMELAKKHGELEVLSSRLDSFKLGPGSADQAQTPGKPPKGGGSPTGPAAGERVSAGLSEILQTMALAPEFGNDPNGPIYQQLGGYVFVIGRHGEQISLFDTSTGQARTVRLGGTPDQPIRVSPVMAPGQLIALLLVGDAINRNAVYDIQERRWYPVDLDEPYKGQLSPLMSESIIAYRFGSRALAYSGRVHRWASITTASKVDETKDSEATNPLGGAGGLGAMPLGLGGPGGMVVNGDAAALLSKGGFDLFSAETGEWQRIDLKAMIDAAIAAEQAAGGEILP